MSTNSKTNQIILDTIQEGVQKGILHLSTNTDPIKGSMIRINNRPVINFSSCSYLGLEHHPSLMNGAKNAIDDYGTQFSSSRAYLSLGLYDELESLLSQLFQQHPVVVTPTTTLGHIAAIPVLVEDGDAVILDHQVHHSLQTAAGLLRSRPVHIEMLRHNNIGLLEERVRQLRDTCKNIWYLADGVYSMYGDFCRLPELVQLLNSYSCLRVYIDDAHGMSYFGKHGSGYVMSQVPLHHHMILATSLNKAFASGGGVLVFPNEELKKKVRTCGSTLITSGPLQPGNLGAAVAATKLHLTDEIYELQDELHEKIKFTRSLIQNAGLPLISDSDAAIFFIGVSVPKLGYHIVSRMLERGHYVNLGIFPAVPIKNTGIRFTITRLLSYRQISNMITALKEEFEQGLVKEGVTREQINKAFKLENKESVIAATAAAGAIRQSLQLTTLHYPTILDIEQAEWDKLFSGRGAFDWKALALLETIFSNNEKPEDNWDFDYIMVTDNDKNIVAATFVTTALWKDDMLSPGDVSKKIEALRKTDPYYLVSGITSAGSLITEGEHIYVNRQHSLWKDALTQLLSKTDRIHLEKKSNGVVLRDILDADEELTGTIAGNGYFKAAMPDTHIAENLTWLNPDEFFQQLSKKGKMHFRTDIRRYYDQFIFTENKSATTGDIQRWYQLYLQVREHNLDINTFPLPEKFFLQTALPGSGWTVNTLVLKETGQEMAVVFSYRSGNTFIPTVIGMDYTYLHSHKIYKQTLFRLLEHAKNIGCRKVQLGFGASLEKKKLNCKIVQAFSFVQLADSFNTEFINNYKSIVS